MVQLGGRVDRVGTGRCGGRDQGEAEKERGQGRGAAGGGHCAILPRFARASRSPDSSSILGTLSQPPRALSLTQLAAKGLVYPCFCTALELEVSRKVQASAGQPARYSGKCAHLKVDEIAAKKAQGLSFTLRFRMPKGTVIEFEDLVRGARSSLPPC
ncbi:MAG: glutamate--tRNA ligase family protein [Burkholderiales bacterium]